jgi:hypothetical protein
MVLSLLTDQGLEWKAGPGAGVDSQPAAQVVQPTAHVLQTLLVPVQLLVQQPEAQRHGRQEPTRNENPVACMIFHKKATINQGCGSGSGLNPDSIGSSSCFEVLDGLF